MNSFLSKFTFLSSYLYLFLLFHFILFPCLLFLSVPLFERVKENETTSSLSFSLLNFCFASFPIIFTFHFSILPFLRNNSSLCTERTITPKGIISTFFSFHSTHPSRHSPPISPVGCHSFYIAELVSCKQ